MLKECPKCGQHTFSVYGYQGECSNCGYTMKAPPNEGRGGRGQKCVHCGRWTVFNGKCTNCGARYE